MVGAVFSAKPAPPRDLKPGNILIDASHVDSTTLRFAEDAVDRMLNSVGDAFTGIPHLER
jgi:hypothetical protein